jgi:hypothetical protein
MAAAVVVGFGLGPGDCYWWHKMVASDYKWWRTSELFVRDLLFICMGEGEKRGDRNRRTHIDLLFFLNIGQTRGRFTVFYQCRLPV